MVKVEARTANLFIANSRFLQPFDSRRPSPWLPRSRRLVPFAEAIEIESSHIADDRVGRGAFSAALQPLGPGAPPTPSSTGRRVWNLFRFCLSGATLTAHLSDSSAPDFVDTTSPASGNYDRNYTLTYSAGAPGQTLTVTWLMSAGAGNVTLNGAALSTLNALTPQTISFGSLSNVNFGVAPFPLRRDSQLRPAREFRFHDYRSLYAGGKYRHDCRGRVMLDYSRPGGECDLCGGCAGDTEFQREPGCADDYVRGSE